MEKQTRVKKLLLIGSGSVHTYNYYRLIEGFFEHVRLITDKKIQGNDDIDLVWGDFSIRNPLRLVSNIRQIRKEIREFEPDLIHVHQANSTSFLSLWAARFDKHIPIVVTAWGSDIQDLPADSFILGKMVVYILKNADWFTADALCVAEKMKELNPALRHDILIANFGIEPFYRPVKKENIIYSNRLHLPLYRIDSVIEAFGRFVGSAHEPWKLVIAGQDQETELLKKLTRSAGLASKVEFIGWADSERNNEMYCRARIFVSIPRSDATAISLLEAMHAGCIPVVSDLPAAREWITDGRNGVIVASLKENFFERALLLDPEKVASINSNIISEKGLKSVNREKFLGLYKKILRL